MNPRKDNKGQALLEMTLAFTLLIPAMAVFLGLCYRGVLFYSIDKFVYEAVLCTDDKNIFQCKNELQKNISKVLIAFNQETTRIHLSRSGKTVTGSAEVDFSKITKQWNVPLKISKSVTFPLKAADYANFPKK